MAKWHLWLLQRHRNMLLRLFLPMHCGWQKRWSNGRELLSIWIPVNSWLYWIIHPVDDTTEDKGEIRNTGGSKFAYGVRFMLFNGLNRFIIGSVSEQTWEHFSSESGTPNFRCISCRAFPLRLWKWNRLILLNVFVSFLMVWWDQSLFMENFQEAGNNQQGRQLQSVRRDHDNVC